jgi:hypothetical protein
MNRSCRVAVLRLIQVKENLSDLATLAQVINEGRGAPWPNLSRTRPKSRYRRLSKRQSEAKYKVDAF